MWGRLCWIKTEIPVDQDMDLPYFLPLPTNSLERCGKKRKNLHSDSHILGQKCIAGNNFWFFLFTESNLKLLIIGVLG